MLSNKTLVVKKFFIVLCFFLGKNQMYAVSSMLSAVYFLIS